MSRPPSKKRMLVLKLISILLPFGLLCLLEAGLRVFHYGSNLDLFIEYPGNKDFLVLNPDASKKYFTDQQIATTGNIEPFKKKKDGNTLRIFVLGESTTIGYPYFHNGSFHRWLQYRLMHEFPDRNFEIINLSLTAVNSYTVAGFAKEVVHYEPDAVLIYTGHNEYYGALGVGSTDKLGNNPALVNALLGLRELRLVQLLTNAYERIRGWFGSHGADSGRTRMEMMVGEQQIPYGSKLYTRGIEQFRTNMDKTLALFHEHRIPVFISDVVSNEKDIRPFISVEVDSTRYPGFAKNYALGAKELEMKDSTAAYAAFIAAERAFDGHALCDYYLGRLAYARGDFQQAGTWLCRARDLDELRFRAPAAIDSVIVGLSGKYDNTHLVETKAAFDAHSPHLIPGNELILEHVHPNLAGYALLSEVFYQAMKRQGLFSVPDEKEMSFSQLLQDMPVTKVDSLAGMYRVHKLKMSWPFTLAENHDSVIVGTQEEELAYSLAFKQLSWSEVMDQLYNYYMDNRDLPDGARLMEGLVLEHPMDYRYSEKTAMLYGQMGNYGQSVFYFRKSFSLQPSFEKAKDLFVLLLKLDRPGEALPYLDWAIQNNPSGQDLQLVKQYVVVVISLKKNLAADSTNLPLLNEIADKYRKMGNHDGSLKYNMKVLGIDPKNKEALDLAARLKLMPG